MTEQQIISLCLFAIPMGFLLLFTLVMLLAMAPRWLQSVVWWLFIALLFTPVIAFVLYIICSLGDVNKENQQRAEDRTNRLVDAIKTRHEPIQDEEEEEVYQLSQYPYDHQNLNKFDASKMTDVEYSTYMKERRAER